MKTTHRFATGLLISLTLLAPSVARANTYTVEGCGANGAGVLQFSSEPASAFTLTDAECNASSSPTFASIGYQASDTFTQGDQASWGVQAPAGETISGLGVKGGLYIDSAGWLSGWTLNGNISQNALPSQDDCLSYSSSPCSASGGSWFPVGGATSIQMVMFCDASAVPSIDCSVQSDFSNSVLALNDAVVQVQDPGDAATQVSGSLWSAGHGIGLTGGWVSGVNASANLSMEFQATDPGGVCRLEAALVDSQGNVVASSTPVSQTPTTDSNSAAALAYNVPAPFPSTQPCGGPNTGVSTFAPDLATLPTGTYFVNVASQNPGEYQAGSYTYAAGDTLAGGAAIKVDNSIPSVTVTPSASNVTSAGSGQSWVPTPESVTVAASDAPSSSGLAQITCTTPVGTTSYPLSGDQGSVTVNVATPGSDSISCNATSIAGNTSPVASANFDVDAQVPTVSFSGADFAPAWNGGTQTVTVTGSEVAQASGIASVSCQLDGGGWSSTTGTVTHLTITGDGEHEVSCYATSVAGVSSPTTSDSIQIDSDAPTLVFGDGPDESAWHTSGQTVTAIAKAVGGDAISSIECTLAGTKLSYPNSSGSGTESAVIPVVAPGGDLNCAARDSAGNVSSSESWSFLIDDTPPTGYFAVADAADPTLVAVSVADAGSGVASAQIEMDISGKWSSLPTRFERHKGIATAQIPDDGTLRNGTYALRAKVRDRAGNSVYLTQNAAGTAESIALPLRELTNLTAVMSAGHSRVAASASLGAGHLSVKYGQRLRISGRLATADGIPVPRATIVISQRLANSAAIRTVAKVLTSSMGTFARTVAPGPSRTLLVTYEGSALLRSAVAATNTRVGGRVSLSVPSMAVAGRRVTLRGRVAGGQVPRAGLLVQLWYSADSGGNWQPFEHAVRASALGRWALTFRVSSEVRGRNYAFKAVVAAQDGWPYAGAVSESASLRVV